MITLGKKREKKIGEGRGLLLISIHKQVFEQNGIQIEKICSNLLVLFFFFFFFPFSFFASKLKIQFFPINRGAQVSSLDVQLIYLFHFGKKLQILSLGGEWHVACGMPLACVCNFFCFFLFKHYFIGGIVIEIFVLSYD